MSVRKKTRYVDFRKPDACRFYLNNIEVIGGLDPYQLTLPVGRGGGGKMGKITEISCNKVYGGFQKVYSHESTVLKCTMKFGIYVPPMADSDAQLPVLYWLSGLSCTEQNFITKAGAQRYASDLGIILVNPDTSPRGCNIPGEDDCYDFGSGAGFYVNATEAPWKDKYQMYDYVTKELPAVINENFQTDPERMSIFGHSMGGHGALICALKNPGLYKSVSAFAPICHPMISAWGKKAFSGYLGNNEEAWKEYDATCVLENYNGPQYDILIDQGKEDEFLKENQLEPQKFVEACSDGKMPIILRMQEGYDHSYYFIQSFMEDHLRHHAKFLK